MEKNKGLFSFRKHPVGDFPDGKKGRKRKGGRLRRSMGFLMAAVLIFNTLPASGLAVSASEQEKGLCEHHPEHTAECGYREAQPCTHEHTDECYKIVTECVHEHTDECYPETEESTEEGSAADSGAEGREPENCTHVCSEENGCITKVLDCHHEHDESCGYKEAQECGYVCDICNGIKSEDTEDTDTDTAECICETLCTEDSINGDCPVCGADDASFLDCKGKVPEENTENQEDTGICKHHQEHDADCGYIPKSEDGEGSPCTYECRICPIEDLIAALPEQVTEDNEEEVRAQLDEILALYRELDEDEQGQIDLSRCLELQEALDNANAPMMVVGEINIDSTRTNILTEEAGDCPGHTFTGTTEWDAWIYVESGTHDVTFSNLSITKSANVGIAPGATMNLIIEGTNTIKSYNSAGIYVPVGATLVINGTGSLDVSGDRGGAGIGGATYAPDETGSDGNPNCGTVEINGGTITATGGNLCTAGIGGGTDTYCNPGNGGTVIINGGTVTATGGNDDYYGGAGIGGSSNGDSGDGGTLTINGGRVTLTAGTHDIQYPAYGFGRGSCAPNVSGGTCELTLADASYLDSSTTLDPKGKYTINGDPTADMIVVPEDLIYNGKAQELDGKIYIDDSKTGTGTYFEQTFTVKASADGWVLQDLGDVVEAGEYTATFKKDDKEISKTFTVAQSGTDLADGKVKTYNGSEETTSFSAGDTITVKATPTATGTAPQKAAARLRGGPSAGQMALYVGDMLVSSEAANADADGTYTMTVSASDVLTLGGVEPNGDPITLTAKFVGNDNMADAAGTVDVRISAVAMAELNGAVIGYYGAGNLDAAFEDSGNAGATFTLLANVEPNTYLTIQINCILNLGGHTITGYIGSNQCVCVDENTAVTILGEGEIIAPNGIALAVDGSVTLEGGTYTSTGSEDFSHGVQVSQNATLSVTGEKVTIRNTGGGSGLNVDDAQSVQLSAGTYSGAKAIESIVKLSDMLVHTDNTRYAYYQNDIPVTKASAWVDNNIGDVPLDTPIAWLSDTVTVKACNHAGEGVCTYTHNENTSTHTKTCLACGKTWDAEDCAYTFSGGTGTCAACGDSVTVAVAGTENLVYDGTEKGPGVTVMRGTTELTVGTDYTVAYADNIDVGTAKVTVTIGNNQGTYNGNFSIGKATPTITWSSTSQELTYSGSPAVITAPTVTLENNENFGGTISYSYKKQGETAYKDGLPTDAGTYTIKAHVGAEGNYNAADSTNELALIISYMAAPKLQYNGSDKKEYYNRDVAVTAVPADSHTYLVSDTLGGDYEASYTISAQEGTMTKTLYFKDEAGHMSDGVEVSVKFDRMPPTGEIAVGAKWWQNVLHFISFGNYKAKEYTITIEAEDKNGSGISKIEYVIVTGSSQYTDADTLKAANLSWTEYNSGSQPTVDANTSQYVVYARLTDNAGNVTYISTDGILLDSTAPAVDALTVPEETKKDVTAGVTFTVSEAADYYYVVLPQGSAAPSAKDIIMTCGGTLPEGGTGTAIAGTVDSGKGAVSGDSLPARVSVEAKNLQPYTEYIVYVTAVDRAVDITNSAEGTPAGNIADVVNTGFTTKKTLPVITKAPAVTGTYGQTVGEMTMTGGAAVDGKGTAVTGTWEVSSADRDKKPSAGTAEKVIVIFTPDSDSFDSVSVQITPAASPRNLNAEGVTVSEVAGNYTYTGSEIKPPVAAGTGTPTSGISISDSGAVLTANDFTVSYSNNKDAGTASVTITGKGNYTGSVTRTFTIGKAPGREVPDVSGSHTDNGQTYTYTVTPTEGAVYRMDNGAWQAENIFKDIKPGTSVTFYAMMPEDKNYEEGTPKYITVDFPKLTPAAPALTYKADRTNPADVKVAITPVSGAEYSFDGGKTWTESNEQGGFTTSDTVTLAIRLKGTDTHNQSPARTMTVNLAKEDREAPPAFSLKVEANGETDYTVTIPATEGCEYSFDGEHWSDVNVKTGVSVGETVTGYKRYKETNDYNASSAVSAKETMPKFTVKTPVISPAGGSYSGSVSVTITCGSTDAEIYYTTDGSTPGRSSTRYTGAFTVSAPATVKAVAIKDGLNDSAVATVSYTKKDGGGSGGGNSGGSSGGSENNGGSGGNDEGQGSGGGGSTNPGNGNATPQPSVTQPTDTNTSPGNETAPGTGTTPVNPGNGNTVRPGTAPGSGIGTPAQGTKQPFIKDEDGKTGWDVIRAEEEQAQEGSIINVDMNGSVVVPGDIFDSIKGKDITVTFDMGNGIIWSVDGKSITTDKAGDIDFSVKTETNTIPVDIVNNVTGERYSIQISLAYEGEFGFTAVLSIGLGRENAGYTASLYYYNESTGELEFICSDEVAEDGTVSLAFTHASDYVIAIDGEEESDSATEPAQPEDQDGDSTGQAEESPQAGQAWRPWWLIVVGALVIIMGIGVFFVVKKGKDGDSGQ